MPNYRLSTPIAVKQSITTSTDPTATSRGELEIETLPRMPYQYPQPKEALPELVIPDAIPQDERIWVPQAENVWFRPLCLNVSSGYWMNVDPWGKNLGFEDVFTKNRDVLPTLKKVGLGEEYVRQFVR